MLHEMFVSIESVTPMIQHNGQLANPLNPHTKAIKEYTSKRKKTDADMEQIADLEWEGSLYLDETKQKVIVPSEWIEGMLISAGKKKKLGQVVKIGIICDGKFPLIHHGPKTIAELKADPDFRDIRGVTVNQSRVMRCRPIFHKWALNFTILYDDEHFNKDTVVELLGIAGMQIGLSDFRPKYGRFLVKSVKMTGKKAG